MNRNITQRGEGKTKRTRKEEILRSYRRSEVDILIYTNNDSKDFQTYRILCTTSLLRPLVPETTTSLPSDSLSHSL